MVDTNSRLSALEAENFELRSRLAALEAAQPAAKKPAAPRPQDDRPLVTTYLPVANPKHLPNDDECRALLRVVTARYPKLKFRNADDELESFRAAFAYIVTLTKTAQPVRKFAASWWIDQAQAWCRAAGVQGVVRSLLPAIVGCGDVNFTLDDPATVWLDAHRSSSRAVDAQKWRRILNGDDLLAPIPIKTMVDNSIGHVHVQSAW